MYQQQQQYAPYEYQIFDKREQTANVQVVGDMYQSTGFTIQFRTPRQFKVHGKPFAMQNINQEGQTKTADPDEEQYQNQYSEQMQIENPIIFGDQIQDQNNIIYSDDIKPIREVLEQQIKQDNSSQFPLKLQVRPISEHGYLLKDSAQLLPVLVSLYSQTSISNIKVPKMMGFDFICLIDNSSFTNEFKLMEIKQALTLLNKFTTQKDRMCLITYNILLQKLNQLKYIQQNEFQELLKLIQNTNILSSNLCDAMNMAIKMIHDRQYKGNQIFVLIFTTRFDNTDYNKQLLKNILNSTQDLFHTYSFGFSSHNSLQDLNNIVKIKLGYQIIVQDIQSLDYHFAQIFAGQTILAAENINITIKTLPNNGLKNIKINRAYGDRWKLDSKQHSCNMLIPYCPQNMIYQYIIELILPQGNNSSQKLNIISVDLSYYDPLKCKEYKFQTYNQSIIIHKKQQNNIQLNQFVLQIYNETVYKYAITEAELELLKQEQQGSQNVQIILDKWKFSVVYEKMKRYLTNLLKL